MIIIARRRGLIGAKKANRLVFSLYNHAVETGDVIQTEYKPLQTGAAVTILFDMATTANPTSGTGRVWKLIVCYNSAISGRGLYIGKKGATNQAMTNWWVGVETSMSNSSTSVGRQRIAVTHEPGSDDLIVKYKKDNGTLRSYTFTQSFVAANNTLQFGADADQSLPAGTINKVEVYDYILDSAAITEFFN